MWSNYVELVPEPNMRIIARVRPRIALATENCDLLLALPSAGGGTDGVPLLRAFDCLRCDEACGLASCASSWAAEREFDAVGIEASRRRLTRASSCCTEAEKPLAGPVWSSAESMRPKLMLRGSRRLPKADLLPDVSNNNRLCWNCSDL